LICTSTAVTIQIVDRLAKAPEIRVAELRQHAASDQCVDLVAIRRTRRLRRRRSRSEQLDECSHREQQDLRAVAARGC
jgi:hypothetical protein